MTKTSKLHVDVSTGTVLLTVFVLTIVLVVVLLVLFVACAVSHSVCRL